MKVKIKAMNTVFNIARKEFIDTVRDKRTLIVMIIVPLLLFPVVFTFVGNIQKSSMQEAYERELKIGYVSESSDLDLVSFIEENEEAELIQLTSENNYGQLIKQDSLDAILYIPADWSYQMDDMETATVEFYFASTQEAVEERIQKVLKDYEKRIIDQRLVRLELGSQVVDPVEVKNVDVATVQEKLGKYAGGLIPYVFIIFCFIGAMYPAIDLFTGEKERMTIETILTTPVSRLEILTGKMIVVVITGIISALLAIVGLFLGLNFADTLPTQIIDVAGDILQVNFIVLLLSMLIPLTIFFAGILIPISIYAKSFKEAQSIITPINILVIVPAIVGLLPGVELSAQTAAIPVVNIALATKDIVAGTINYGHLAIVYGSLIIIAIATVMFSVKYFAKENNILRV
jgi:sodium transport system permease protein